VKKKLIEMDMKKARSEAVQAMGQAQGHWFTCPNNHPYYIGDCGGATQESNCPDCGAKVGGSSHKTRSDNRLATEMDGATKAAWPQ